VIIHRLTGEVKHIQSGRRWAVQRVNEVLAQLAGSHLYAVR
jgi:hypothetical protein